MNAVVDYKRRELIYYSASNSIRTATVESNDGLKNVIAVILESPHKDEFSGCITAPAMGRTGDYFFKYFNQLFPKSRLYRKINPKQTYDLVFVNAVQYQTSCGASLWKCPTNLKQRNKNWKKIFQDCGGAYDLLKRLKALHPCLVLNLCTGGKAAYGLRSRVKNRVQKKYPDCYTCGTHPSSWTKDSRVIY